MPRNNEIQFRRGTVTEWSTIDPILASGEPAFNLTNYSLKIGDGKKEWSLLPEITGSGVGGPDIYLSGVSFDNNTRNLTFTWNSTLPDLTVNIPGGSGGTAGNTLTYQNINTNTTLSYNDHLIFVDTSSNSVDIQLPLASGYGGTQFILKQKTGNNPINILASGSETIDDQSQYQIFYSKNSISVVSDNSNWYIV